MISRLFSEEVTPGSRHAARLGHDADRCALYRAFRFADFIEAIGFMMRGDRCRKGGPSRGMEQCV